jgi:protein-tyrosine phosphatase
MNTETPTMNPTPRRVPLRGAVNFRDLGGYRTADGRAVKWRTVYRSDSLADLDAEDLAEVAALGLRSLFDLRHDHERERLPNRLPEGDTTTVHNIGFFPHGVEQMLRDVRAGRATPAEVDELFREMYRRLPLDHAEVYGELLQRLVQPDALPAVFHCTSGKDRTGFAAVVLLTALGVPRATIVEDYLLTNQFRRDLRALLGHDVDPALLDIVKQAHPDYLGAAFASVDARWGSDDAFLEQGLGFAPEQRVQLQALLLEPA